MGKKKPKKHDIDFSEEIKRLNRVVGQIEGVQKMLKSGRKLEETLAQCKAVHSAMRAIESRIVKSYLEIEIDEITKSEKKKSREKKIANLEQIFKYAS